jgi:uncharacterized phiE125 gp8 family phage protein
MARSQYYYTSTPASEPVSTADMKTHLRVTHSDDDTYIDGLVKAARTWIEDTYDVSIITRTVTENFDGYPITAKGDKELELTVRPISNSAGVVVKYYDTDNQEQTLGASNYIFVGNVGNSYGRIRFITAPSIYDRPGALFVEYSAGTDTAADVFIQAIKLLVTDWYDNRGRGPGNETKRSLDAVERLLHVYG